MAEFLWLLTVGPNFSQLGFGFQIFSNNIENDEGGSLSSVRQYPRYDARNQLLQLKKVQSIASSPHLPKFCRWGHSRDEFASDKIVLARKFFNPPKFWCKATEIRDLQLQPRTLDFTQKVAHHEDHLEGYSACSDLSRISWHCLEPNPATTADANSFGISDKQN